MWKLEKLDQNDRDILSVTSSLNANLNSTVKRVEQLEKGKSVSDVYIKMLLYHSIDLEACSRISNLMFYGLADLSNEDTYQVLTDFFSDYLELDLNDFFIQRVHRIGSLHRVQGCPR